jgi:hypothetical protein
LIHSKTKNEQGYIYIRKPIQYESRLLRTLNRDINLWNYWAILSIEVLQWKRQTWKAGREVVENKGEWAYKAIDDDQTQTWGPKTKDDVLLKEYKVGKPEIENKRVSSIIDTNKIYCS